MMIVRPNRVGNTHSCRRWPACPNGASNVKPSPVPKPSSEIEKLWTRTWDMATSKALGVCDINWLTLTPNEARPPVPEEAPSPGERGHPDEWEHWGVNWGFCPTQTDPICATLRAGRYDRSFDELSKCKLEYRYPTVPGQLRRRGSERAATPHRTRPPAKP